MKEDIKMIWSEAKVGAPSTMEIDELLAQRRYTALERLARRYRNFSIISAVAIIVMPIMMMNMGLLESAMIPLIVCADLYFFLASVMDLWLSNGVSKIDCALMPVKEVVRKATFYRKRHLQFVMILLPMAIALVGSMVYFREDYMNKYFLIGVISGALVGLIIGSSQLMRFLRDYKDLGVGD